MGSFFLNTGQSELLSAAASLCAKLTSSSISKLKIQLLNCCWMYLTGFESKHSMHLHVYLPRPKSCFPVFPQWSVKPTHQKRWRSGPGSDGWRCSGSLWWTSAPLLQVCSGDRSPPKPVTKKEHLNIRRWIIMTKKINITNVFCTHSNAKSLDLIIVTSFDDRL